MPILIQLATFESKFKFLAFVCHNSSQWQQVAYQISLYEIRDRLRLINVVVLNYD